MVQMSKGKEDFSLAVEVVVSNTIRTSKRIRVALFIVNNSRLYSFKHRIRFSDVVVNLRCFFQYNYDESPGRVG